MRRVYLLQTLEYLWCVLSRMKNITSTSPILRQVKARDLQNECPVYVSQEEGPGRKARMLLSSLRLKYFALPLSLGGPSLAYVESFPFLFHGHFPTRRFFVLH